MKKILLAVVLLLLATGAIAKPALISKIEGLGGGVGTFYENGQYYLVAIGTIVKVKIATEITTAELDRIKDTLIKANAETKKLGVGDKGKEHNLMAGSLYIIIWGDNDKEMGRKINLLLATDENKLLIIFDAGKDTEQAAAALIKRAK